MSNTDESNTLKKILDDDPLEGGIPLVDYIGTCPQSSTSGTELNVWDDDYFLNTHMIKTKLQINSIIETKTACINLINYFSGMRGLYSNLLSDMQVAILAIRRPSDMSKLLFEEFLTTSSSKVNPISPPDASTNLSKIVIGAQAEYFLNETQDALQADTALAEDILTTQVETDLIQKNPITSSEIETFWNTLLFWLGDPSSQGQVNENTHVACTIIGVISMNCLKLLSRTPESACRSMQNNLYKHFTDLYKYDNLGCQIIPPCASSIRNMSTVIKAAPKSVLNILSLILGKLMIENANPNANQADCGLLYSACLTHIGLYGMASIKYIEQTAAELGLGTAKFCKMILTTGVQQSILNVVHLLKKMNQPIGKRTICGEAYNLPCQITWRFCRIYNSSHYSRFATKLNIALIIRCVAYSYHIQEGNSITSMKLLASSTNMVRFEYEKDKAKYAISQFITKDDTPLSKESTQIYGTTTTFDRNRMP